MNKKIIIILLFLYVTSSCSEKKNKDSISENIELAVKSSDYFKDSELRDFEKYEIINIAIEELPSYNTKLNEIKTYTSLIEEALLLKKGEKLENGLIGDISVDNIDNYIKTAENEINSKEYQLSLMRKMYTDTMYKVICKENIKINDRVLSTYAHVYLNNEFKIVDYTH